MFYDLLRTRRKPGDDRVSRHSEQQGQRASATKTMPANCWNCSRAADNGYDQNDIILMSRAWTGWSVELVDAPNVNNSSLRHH